MSLKKKRIEIHLINGEVFTIHEKTPDFSPDSILTGFYRRDSRTVFTVRSPDGVRYIPSDSVLYIRTLAEKE